MKIDVSSYIKNKFLVAEWKRIVGEQEQTGRHLEGDYNNPDEKSCMLRLQSQQ